MGVTPSPPAAPMEPPVPLPVTSSSDSQPARLYLAPGWPQAVVISHPDS